MDFFLFNSTQNRFEHRLLNDPSLARELFSGFNIDKINFNVKIKTNENESILCSLQTSK